MAGSPNWKVFRGKEYIASTKYPEEAALLCGVIGGSLMSVKWCHRYLVWNEGEEAFRAGDNFVKAAQIMRERLPKFK